ncbi:ferredoxin-type protein NapF [Solemya velum gill symbiont]|uniref:Ferredoxin-type protein NapF n=1 Tax=Solemya velum gill symbiont TaxID=2340 RepID=A0A0B0HD31_SOVGS|nr:ferredoxin-type protein NapF [Solemya velum gill symbiont]KHF25819.1 periplasmic nitrate reductase napFDAGHBC, subunit F [Solemya velum gill symbiont]OOY34524.1 ferredoxin-type protein NapF [Solemya velum gill symbiont]OOY37239.1 ferredoxin-type protein NapF [Solemya velum gill symbiont]OOY39767.1 ferredoxin-type protein NapF [Solemya velum gill symbiont]OOY47116.1 ferredoxin-type protein NapF [Solemya velum gill symbiont]
MNRKQFLRGNKTEYRPPWAIDEDRFTELCNRCSDCFSACKENIIEKGRGGFPQINFQQGECLFCGDCVEQCQTGALQKSRYEADAAPWMLKVQVSDKCLNFTGVVCRSCGDRCAERAIRFRPQIGGKQKLQLDYEMCTGCGACIAPCPVQAVKLIPVSESWLSEQESLLEVCA